MSFAQSLLYSEHSSAYDEMLIDIQVLVALPWYPNKYNMDKIQCSSVSH